MTRIVVAGALLLAISFYSQQPPPAKEKTTTPPCGQATPTVAAPQTGAPAQRQYQSEGYQDTRWGMGISDVKKVLTNCDKQEIRQEGRLLFCKSKAAGRDALIAYYFTKADELFQVQISILDPAGTGEEKWLEDFDYLADLLTQKYGKPKNIFKPHSDNDYVKDALCIQTGECEWSAYWFTEGTAIALSLSGENYEYSEDIKYQSNTLINKAIAELKSDQTKSL
jgi:hypothetical protein